MPPTDEQLRRILRDCKVIAVVGMSKNPGKDAHAVPMYLRSRGYTVIPVNPTTDDVAGLKAYASLRDVPGPVDLVDVFRPSADVPGVVEDALRMRSKPRVLWTQLGIRSPALAEARAAGIEVVEDRCLRVEWDRLLRGADGAR